MWYGVVPTKNFSTQKFVIQKFLNKKLSGSTVYISLHALWLTAIMAHHVLSIYTQWCFFVLHYVKCGMGIEDGIYSWLDYM